MSTNNQTKHPFTVKVWGQDCSYDDSTVMCDYVARRIGCDSERRARALASQISGRERTDTSVVDENDKCVASFSYDDFEEPYCENDYDDYDD